MKSVLTVTVVVVLAALGLPAHAQWLNHPTPNIPRASNGNPNLAAPAPRGADGHPDLSGVWTTGPAVVIPIPDEALTPKSKALIHEREENYFKDRPAFRCQPSGPATAVGWRRIIQTPSTITILYENVTYRVIFMDGRRLEADPERTWMGYSVGRWEGDTLVVDSFGFNDRTWLDAVGLPHTEALRTTERYRRRNLGQVQVALTVTDPGAFAKPWTVTQNLQFGADTDMVEAFCETDQSHWIGRLADVEHDAVTVPPMTLVKYVGVYSGLWGTRPRTVHIQLEGGTLYANGVADEKVRLVPHSETFFMATNGLSYDFDPEGNPATFIVERHVSGDWRFSRQPAR
jgi:hypothetical protein